MQHRIIALIFVVCLAGLAGCQTPVVDETGPLAIRSVSVSVRPEVQSVTYLAPTLQAAVSAELGGGDAAGTAADLKISVDQVTYKDPLMSILIGSRNSLATNVTLTGVNGTVLATLPHGVVLDSMINGVAGAIIAVVQDKTAVDRALVERYAKTLKVRIYGRPGHKPKKAAPAIAAPAAAAPAAAPAGQPVPTPASRQAPADDPVPTPTS